MKKGIVVLAVLAAAGGGVYAYRTMAQGHAEPAKAAHAPPPQTVAAQTAKVQPWLPSMELVGELRASRGADLALQVSGIVQKISFESGDSVEAGTPLLQLNADDQAANLKSLEATAELNAINLARDVKQLQVKAVSQAAVDTAEANLKNARALVSQQQALVEQYSLEAPFSGRLGIRNVDLGQYVSAGTTIVTLQALDPIFADFSVPQRYLSQLADGASVRVSVDAWPGKVFEGAITAISPKVDSATRNVRVRASLGNPEAQLKPGMFAKVTVQTGKPENFVTLPQTAIVSNPYGSTVFVLEKGADGKQLVARQSIVKTGQTRGDLVAVLSGVKEGDTVVIAGQMKLRNGTPAVIDNSGIPEAQASSATAE